MKLAKNSFPLERLLDRSHRGSLLINARKLFSHGYLMQAHRELHRLLAVDSNSHEGWHLLGKIYLQWKEYPVAINCLKESLACESQVCESRAEVQLELADIYLLAGFNQQAEDLYLSLSTEKISDTSLVLKLSRRFFELGNIAQAIAQARLATTLDTNCADAFYDLSCYLAVAGAPAALVEANGRRAIFLDGEKLLYRLGLARYFHSLGRLFDASELIKDALPCQIQLLTCPCCLNLLDDLFGILGKYDMRALCQKRIRDLRISTSVYHQSRAALMN